jgi:mannose/cellobiose epimerase-like protein (N-acyl-D-glucosamine 2-epimerase family)
MREIKSMHKILAAQSGLLSTWLEEVAFPLWSTKGFDEKTNLFHENIERDGSITNDTQRSMVQARQIYCTSAMIENGAPNGEALKARLASVLKTYIATFQRPNGAFSFSISSHSSPHSDSDLYAQAFALFALARGFLSLKDPALEAAALKLLTYLGQERRLRQGGYSEFEKGKAVCRSNPHMHLFEAAVEWMIASKNSHWSELAAELFSLFDKKILSQRPMIAEEFDDTWEPLLNAEGAFYIEPGHHFEWAWLIARYAGLTNPDHLKISERLFAIGNEHGVMPHSETAVDQVWSNGKVKSSAARFWPQCERIKAASYLARKSSGEKKANYERAALRSAANLTDYLQPIDTGLWSDSRDAHGAMIYGRSKGSSLYHIAGAILELQDLAREK